MRYRTAWVTSLALLGACAANVNGTDARVSDAPDEEAVDAAKPDDAGELDVAAPDVGCDADLMTSHDHCGACGVRCASTRSCISGHCVDPTVCPSSCETNEACAPCDPSPTPSHNTCCISGVCTQSLFACAPPPPSRQPTGLADLPAAPLPAGCVRAIAGTSPVSLRLVGYGFFYESLPNGAVGSSRGYRSFSMRLDLPAGRVVGAAVNALAYNSFLRTDIGPSATFDDALSATLGGAPGGAGPYRLLPAMHLRMEGPDGGPEGIVFMNTASGTDLVSEAVGRVRFCVDAEVALATLTAGGQCSPGAGLVAPDDAVWLASSAPLTPEALAGVHVRVGATEYANTASAAPRGVAIATSRALPPGAEVTVTDVPARDVVGRPVTPATWRLRVLDTTDVVRDLTFAAAPPAGAVTASSNAPGVAGGALRFSHGLGGATTLIQLPYAMLVALGDVGGARRVRIRVTPTTPATRFRLVNVGGERVDAAVVSTTGPVQTRAAVLPSGGVWWLSITDPSVRPDHDEFPLAVDDLALDDIALE